MKLLVPMLALLAACPACAGPLRDPFKRPVAAAGAAVAAAAAGAAVADYPEQPKPQLRAILFARGHALADINGQVLREGDWFGDWRLARIEERRVNLKRGKDNLVLLLDREKAQ
jgi:hypothetical protein